MFQVQTYDQVATSKLDRVLTPPKKAVVAAVAPLKCEHTCPGIVLSWNEQQKEMQ